MGLVDLKTDLKSLKFGKDRPFGGSSNQPYITKGIPDNLPVQSPDFLLRNGFLNPLSSKDDVLRLTKYFTDLRSPLGLLFVAKQEALSRSGVRTQAAIGPFNGKVYNPLTTVAQAGLLSIGTHLDKQGIAGGAFAGVIPSINYYDRIKLDTTNTNRLVGLFDSKIQVTQSPAALLNNISPVPGQLLAYNGGPGSALGIGRTVINIATTNKGSYTVTGHISLVDPISQGGSVDYGNLLGVSSTYNIANPAAKILDKTLNQNPGLGINTLNTLFDPQIYKIDNNQKIVLGPTGPILDGTSHKPKKADIAASENKNSYLSSLGLSSKYQISTGSDTTPINPDIYKPVSGSWNENATGPILDPTLNNKKIVSQSTATSRNKSNVRQALGLSTKYETGVWGEVYDLANTGLISGSNTPSSVNSVYVDSNLTANPATTTDLNVYTYTNEQIQNQVAFSTQTGKLQDFRKALRGTAPSSSMAATAAPSYIDQNIEKRVLLGDPGRRGKNLSSYTNGPGLNGQYTTKQVVGINGTQEVVVSPPLDIINALPIYRSTAVTGDVSKKNDLVKFRIAAIDNNAPNFKEFIHFRAFLNNFSDSYQAAWNPIQYIGRGENFYTYGGFTRTISMGWTVAAQSKPELIAMYKKLNFLASNLAPDYSGAGYMRGPLIQLTMGGYIYEQPGFITAMTLDIPEESTWDIGISDDGGNDPTVKELPHMIKVSGFQFTPIHDFIPRKQKNIYNDQGEVTAYGGQPYIDLATNDNINLSNWNDVP